MNTLENRLARIIAVHQGSIGDAESQSFREHRLAREGVIQEIPRLTAMLASVIADLNERLFGSGLELRLSVEGHTPVAEALYVVSLLSGPDDVLRLQVSLNGAGQMRAVLPDRGSQPLRGPATLAAANKNSLTDLLLDFLEVEYH